MDTRKLASFVRAVDAGGVTAAAQSLHLAQSAVSQHVAALEREFGARLLVRGRGGVEVTDAGRSLYRYAQAVLRLERAAHLDLAEHRDVSGLVTVGLATCSAAAGFAGELLRTVRERHPRVRLHLIEHLTTVMSQAVDSGQADLAVILTTGPVRGVRFSHELVEELLLVAGPAADLPTPPRGGVPVAVAARRPFVLPDPQHTVRQVVERRVHQAGAVLDVVAEVESEQVLREAVLAGPEVTVLPASAVRRLFGEDHPGVRVARFAGGLPVTLALAVPDPAPRSEAAAVVAELLGGILDRAVDRGRAAGAG